MKKINKLMIVPILLLFSVFIVSASLGSFQVNDCVHIVTNLNSSAVNISVLTSPSPEPQILIQDSPMTKLGSSFNYTFCDTNKTGTYTYGYCTLEGNCYSNDFLVSPSGTSGNENIAFFILIIVLSYGITFMGVFGRNVVVTILGGMTMLLLGIYLFNNGIMIFRDDITRGISYVTIGLGAVFAIWAGYEWFKDM